jgi:hypothetical protein
MPLMMRELLAGLHAVSGRDALESSPEQSEVHILAGADQHICLGGPTEAGEVAGENEHRGVADVGPAGRQADHRERLAEHADRIALAHLQLVGG